MSIPTVTLPTPGNAAPRLVEPAVYAERLLSREAMERVHLPDDDLLGLRNLRTGELVCVQASGWQRWLHRCG